MKKLSFPTENRQFRFEPKNPYDLVAAEGREAPRDLTFPDWCCILKIVRTHFAACGGEELAQQIAASPHRSKPQKNPQKNIGSNHILILGEENLLIIKSNMKQYKYLGLLLALYITFQLVSDISAGKIITFLGFPVSVTVLFFPITYIFADLLTEVYGYARSRSVVWTVFFSSIIAGLIYQLVVYLPPIAGFDANDAYARVLGSVPRILLGGWIAVWVGGMLNDYVLAKMKVWTGGKYLWTRTIGSTVVGEFANTVLFYMIALYAVLPNNLLFASIISGWLIKVAVEVIFTPLTYYVVRKLKNLEGEDYYDRDTNFNPFIIQPPKF